MSAEPVTRAEAAEWNAGQVAAWRARDARLDAEADTRRARNALTGRKRRRWPDTPAGSLTAAPGDGGEPRPY